uniref:Uncharacterized protein n=1 Tax=viral metagenome TaxID=1070528 RepID=A0A6C0BUV1_9ZZZZ
MYSRRAPDLSEEENKFLDEQSIKEVVDSIISVVSDTLTEVEPCGASLYFDGQTFHHSVDCECMCCISYNRMIISEERDVRRILFPDEEVQDDQPTIEVIEIPEDRTCHSCGMYESFSIRNYECEFIETNEWPTRHLCVDCYDGETYLCQTCGETNTWGIPCQCSENVDFGGWFIDRQGDATYMGEYENEDLPENNTEKVKQVKESVKEMGSLVFDLQEKLTEGEYLQLMDHLQKITNGVNSL